MPEIHTLPLGLCNCYLIKGDGIVLVDAGWHHKEAAFLKYLKLFSINPEDISLIVLTHGHWDHIASVHALKKLTGCKIAVNWREKDWVELPQKPLPVGGNLGRKMLKAMITLYMSSVTFPGTPVDVELSDDDFSLEPYGINGKVIYTPGHTSGSMSVLLDTGDAIVGDLAMNGIPLTVKPDLSIWAEDRQASADSCRLLLSRGARRIYPAHWKSFDIGALKKYL